MHCDLLLDLVVNNGRISYAIKLLMDLALNCHLICWRSVFMITLQFYFNFSVEQTVPKYKYIMTRSSFVFHD